jgi:hypothetical protein
LWNCFVYLTSCNAGMELNCWRINLSNRTWTFFRGKILVSRIHPEAGMGKIEKVGDLISVQSKFLCSGWKSLRLMNWYKMRHFSNDMFSRCLILIMLKQKNLVQASSNTKNIITVSFNTKKSHLSIIYYQEKCEISWNSLKRDDSEKILFKLV